MGVLWEFKQTARWKTTAARRNQNMAKGATRLQKHFIKPEQRKFTTTTNTSTRLRKVYTLVSTPTKSPPQSNEAVTDPEPTILHDLMEEQPEPPSIEVDIPAGIHVRTKAPRYQNSVSP